MKNWDKETWAYRAFGYLPKNKTARDSKTVSDRMNEEDPEKVLAEIERNARNRAILREADERARGKSSVD